MNEKARPTKAVGIMRWLLQNVCLGNRIETTATVP